jgi:hypothetical protein
MSFQFYALGNNRNDAARVVGEALDKVAMAKGGYDEIDVLRNPEKYTGLNWEEAREHLKKSGRYRTEAGN